MTPPPPSTTQPALRTPFRTGATTILVGRAASHRRPGVRWSFIAFGVDATMLAIAVVVSSLAAPAAGVELEPPGWLIAYPVLVLMILRLTGMYVPRIRLQVLDDLRLVVAATSTAAMALVTARVVFTASGSAAAQELVRAWVFALVYLSAGRVGLERAEKRARIRGEAGQATLIIGAGRIGHLVAKRLHEQPELGLQPVGFLDKEPLEGDDALSRLPVLGASWDLEQVVRERDVRHVVITFSTAPDEVYLALARHAQKLGVAVSVVPRLFENMNDKLTVEHLGGLPLLGMHPVDPRGWQFQVKYALDRPLAALALLALSPLLAVLALAVKLSSPGPAFFKQRRVGRDGRYFELLKFRSMREPKAAPTPTNGELPADTAPGGVEGEDRRTRVGEFLRHTSLDELPQFINVLKGDMSLVGPRPERPRFVQLFSDDVYRYAERHRVKSGITGWAQINGFRGQTSISDRAEWDNYYIENWSLWLDFKILLRTVQVVISGRAV